MFQVTVEFSFDIPAAGKYGDFCGIGTFFSGGEPRAFREPGAVLSVRGRSACLFWSGGADDTMSIKRYVRIPAGVDALLMFSQPV